MRCFRAFTKCFNISEAGAAGAPSAARRLIPSLVMLRQPTRLVRRSPAAEAVPGQGAREENK
jgi:hypothetical protein